MYWKQYNTMQCNAMQHITAQYSAAQCSANIILNKKIILNIFTAAVKAVAEGTSKYIYSSNGICNERKG